MTGDVINLRSHRKRKARAERDTKASENRARFGRPKSERKRNDAQKSLDHKRLGEHKRDE
jgi:hypothetical protein